MPDYSSTSITDLATLVADHLAHKDIEVVVVGGLAVEIYTENLYLTKDIDMIDRSYQPPALMQKAMAELGFEKEGRVYSHPTTEIVVEFPAGPLSVGNEIITETTYIEGPAGKIPIISAKDLVKDRLAAFFHWNDNQSLVQALTIMNCHSISPTHLHAFIKGEGESEQLPMIDKLYEHITQNQLSTMLEIENLVLQEYHMKIERTC